MTDQKKGAQKIKKAGPATETASQNIQDNNTPFIASCAREKRILKALIDRPHKLRELMNVCGANNPAEYVRRMRERGLPILTEWQSGVDRDGGSIRFGVYHLLPDDRPRVLAGMEVAHG